MTTVLLVIAAVWTLGAMGFFIAIGIAAGKATRTPEALHRRTSLSEAVKETPEVAIR
jgi:hypothetical protein